MFPIDIPPLRERREDITPLAEKFLRIASRKLMIKTPQLTKAQLNEVERYDWPGNVRELQNVIERATILAAHGAFTLTSPWRKTCRCGAGARSRKGELTRAARYIKDALPWDDFKAGKEFHGPWL